MCSGPKRSLFSSPKLAKAFANPRAVSIAGSHSDKNFPTELETSYFRIIITKSSFAETLIFWRSIRAAHSLIVYRDSDNENSCFYALMLKIKQI